MPKPPRSFKHFRAHMMTSGREGSIMLVKCISDDGPDDLVAVLAYTEKEAIERVKEWLVSIDYDPEFKGMRFKVEPWPDVESITLVEGVW